MNVFTKGVGRVALLMTVCTSFVLSAAAQTNTDRTILSIERNKADNTPTSIGFSPSAKWAPEQAQEIFKQYLGVDGVNTQMRQVYSTTTKMQVTSDRYAEYYKGIKVSYGSFTLMSKDGVVSFISGNYYPFDNSTSATPVITEQSAFSAALNFVGATTYMWQVPEEEARIKSMYHKSDTSFLPKGQLEWIEDYRNNPDERKLHLAWAFNIYASEPRSRQIVYVDAATGQILFSNSLIRHTAASGHTLYSGIVPFVTAHVGTSYRLYDSTRGSGVHTLTMSHGTNYGTAVELTSTTNTWPSSAADTTALDAHWGGEMVYDYWRTQQNRLSWDNLNGILLQYVHYSNNYDNAYWDGTEMTYGDGTGCAAGGFTSLTSLDVTGHEIGHGVCEATANLVYAGESGGMNEGFSDCWGATIENWANPHETDAVTKDPWLIGEEIGCGTPLRSMSAPKQQGQPDTYLGTNWVTVTGCTPGNNNDECGVHTNSGVLNHWYYLVTMGGIGTNDLNNGYNVNAIGWTKAANILYQTELILSSSATYAICRTASISAATTLYGPCSPEVQSVTNAWYAVGVGAAYVPCVPQIGFTNTYLRTTEYAATTTCPASHVVTIGMQPFGPAITGGTAVANIVVASGTAVAGVDYTLTGGSLSWAVGDASIHYATLTIYDNGAINDNKTLKLGYVLTTGSSNATRSPTNDTMQLYIDNNDSIPLTGGVEYHTIDYNTVTSNLTSPFYSSARRAHTQYIIPAAELLAYGLRPNAPISQIAFTVITKNSTIPFSGYTINMANTTFTDLSTAFVTTGLVNVYSGTYTTFVGLDTINFNTNTFTWDGTSNICVEICFLNTANTTANDQVQGYQGGGLICDHNQSTTGTTPGCTLGYSTANQSDAKPVMRFKQTVPPTKVATTTGSSRSWDVHAGQEVYFYNPADTNLIAGLKNVNSNLGCVTATVTQQGVGFTPATFASINRSVKEISITPTTNVATTTYDATIYLTNTELNGVAAGTLFLVKTDAPTDATVGTGNSVEVTPTLITGTNYVGFKGTFTGFSRFFLVDGPLCTTPANTITPSGPTTFCSGSTVQLSVGSGPYTYQWQKGGVNIAGATTASYTANNTGSYTVIVAQGTCSGTSAPVAVTVNTVSVSPITGASPVCVGNTISLADATTGGTWSTSSSAVATVSNTGVVTGLGTGTAIISYSFTNSCGTAVATATVTAGTGIVVAPISGNMTACVGAHITLSDATPAGTWSSGNAGIAGVVPGGVVTGVAGGTATISYNVTNSSGCISGAVATVSITALPSVVVSPAGPVVICTGGNVLLTAFAGTGYTYQWQRAFANIPGATTDTFTASLAGSYDVEVTSPGGCSGTSVPVSVTVSSGLVLVPAVSIAANPGTVLCLSASPVTFTAVPVNGGTAPVYEWDVNNAPMGTGPTYNYVPANGDIVTCKLTSNAACVIPDTASASITMTISAMVTPSVTIAATPAAVCVGDTVTFSALPVFGGTAPTYMWTKNGVNVATGPQYIYAPAASDILKVTMTSNYACLNANVVVSPIAVMSVSQPVQNTLSVSVSQQVTIGGHADTFMAVAPNAGSSPIYQWFVDGLVVPGANNSVYITTALQNGQLVTCAVTSSELCATPRTIVGGGIMVTVIPSGVASVTGTGNVLTLLPNPNKGTFTINGKLNSVADNRVSIIVTDVLGQTVYTKNSEVINGLLDEHIVLSNTLASGTYLVSVTAGTAHQVFHVVIDK